MLIFADPIPPVFESCIRPFSALALMELKLVPNPPLALEVGKNVPRSAHLPQARKSGVSSRTEFATPQVTCRA